MNGYSANEVEKMLGLSPARLSAYVRAGLLSPQRGAEGELRFSFQDLRLLRNAEGLVRERISPHRVRRALQSLHARLDDQQPLSALQLEAEGNGVVVRDGSTRWQAESGQFLLDLSAPGTAAGPDTPVSPLRPRSAPDDDPPTAAETSSPDLLYELACEQEESDPQQARETYLQLLALVPTHAEAHVALGRLLHQRGDLRAAEFHYRSALATRPDDAMAAFNLGLALEDQGHVAAAIEAYERSLAGNPRNADAHYNAAR
ncbi:MAG TPA: tetratricopeptide repeat protein, partial [Polyangia bacterium]|nr:tetratricopeptide repeat protein [Polyangia bacterium]